MNPLDRPVSQDGLPVGFGAVSHVFMEAILGILLMEGIHLPVAVDFG